MKVSEESSKNEEDEKTEKCISDVMGRIAKRQSVIEMQMKFKSNSRPITEEKEEEEVEVNEKNVINDVYYKINEEEDEDGNEDLMKLSKKNRPRFIEKIHNLIKNVQNESKINDIFYISKETKVHFDYFLFFKFFFIHFVYFFLIGPIILIYLLPTEGYFFVYNMGFIGLNRNHVINLLMYLGGGPNILICFYFNSSYSRYKHVFEISELIFCCLAILIRILIIAVRYATTTESFLKFRYEGYLPKEIIKKEYILGVWRNFDPHYLDVEIYESIIRNQIDVEFFKYTVLNYITDEWVVKLSDPYFREKYEDVSGKQIKMQNLVFDNKVNHLEFLQQCLVENEINKQKKNPLIEFYKKLSSNHSVKEEELPAYLRNAPTDILNIHFPGTICFREMMMWAEKFYDTRVSKILAVLIVLRTLMPFLYRFAWGIPVLGSFYLEYYIILVNFTVSLFSYYLNVWFVEIADRDLNIRYIIMQFLSSFINPDKMSYGSPVIRNLPLINIFCSKNMTTWYYLRLLTLDVGKRYFYRLQCYASIYLFCYMLLTFTFVLGYFNVIPMNFDTFPLFILMGGTELIVFSIIMFRYIYLGAQINRFAGIHINQLIKLKENISLLIHHFDDFKKMDHSASVVFERAKFVYNFLMSYRGVCEYQIEINDEFFIQCLSKVNGCIEATISKIEYESKNSPLKLLDTELNFGLINRIYGIAVTVVYSLLQVRISRFLNRFLTIPPL